MDLRAAPSNSPDFGGGRQTLSNQGKTAVLQRVRVMRIELTPQAWEAHVLPLNYTRVAVEAQPNTGIGRLAMPNFVVQGATRFGTLENLKKTKKNLAGRVVLLFPDFQKSRA